MNTGTLSFENAKRLVTEAQEELRKAENDNVEVSMKTGNTDIDDRQINEARERIEMLTWLLRDAIKYLRTGKAQFAPTTTNSDVDCFLNRIDRMEKEGKL